MAIIQVNQTDTFDGFRVKVNQLSVRQGDIDDLDTITRESLVSAINEVKQDAALAVAPESTTFLVVNNNTTTVPFQYNIDSIKVFLNGILLTDAGVSPDYDASSGTSIVFDNGVLVAGDVVYLESFD